MPNDKTVMVRTRERLMGMLNIFTNTDKKNTDSIIDKLQSPGSFSQSELNTLRGINKGVDTTRTVGQMQSDMKAISTNISTKMEESRAIQAMVPEIRKTRNVLVPSILAPNDMYSEDVTVTVDCPKLDDTITTNINSLLTKHVNTKLNIGARMSEWIGEALFDNGATPVMVMPRKIISLLAGEDNSEVSVGNEGNSINNVSISVEDLASGDLGDVDYNIAYADASVSTEEVHAAVTDFLDIQDDSIKNDNVELTTLSTEIQKAIKDDLFITLDNREIKAASSQVAAANKSVEERMGGLVTKHGDTNILSITDQDVGEDVEPIIYKLPTASTIPVHVPGAPSAHIGYFVLVDANGNPIEKNSATTSSSLLSSGQPFVTTFDKLLSDNDSSNDESKYNALSVVFDLIMKKTLKGSLTNLDINAAELPEINSVYACIFNRLLQKESVKLIYVPVSMIGYYAYDFRPDGTGKGLMEDSAFLIGLRTSFLVAKVIGALDNATDKHKITFDMDEHSGTSLEQIMEIIKEAYMEKHMYRLDHNPMNVMRDIISRNISIMPKNMKGFANLEIERDTMQGQAGQVDDQMEETLTNLITTPTNIPAAVFNDLSENEFSRSVATTNIIFSNFVRVLQRFTCETTGVIVKAYARNSYAMTNGIKEILSDQIKQDDPESFANHLAYILDNIKVTLPAPNVSPDKAKYEELNNIIDIIDTIVERNFPEDLIIALDDDTVKDTLMAMRADTSRRMVRSAISQVGPTSMLDMANIDDVKFEDIRDVNLMVKNYSKGIKNLHDALSASDDVDSDGGSGW